MLSLLKNLLHLDAVSHIVLLSKNGVPLYRMPSHKSVPEKKEQEMWKSFAEELNYLQNARLVFDQGSCCFFQTAIGFLIVLFKDQRKINEIKSICTSFDEMAVDFNIRKDFLLQILFESDDFLKLSVLDELAAIADSEIGLSLTELLKKHQSFHHDVKDNLLLLICRLLGDCYAPETMESLSNFIDEYIKSEDQNAEVEQEARVSLRQLEFTKQQKEENQSAEIIKSETGQEPQDISVQNNKTHERIESSLTETNELQHSNINNSSTKAQKKITIEERIKDLLAKGKKQEAVTIIMKYIEAAARQKMFEKAEKLRDTLIKIDSMRLSEIIRAAEIIEEHKAASIEPEDLETWSTLVETLGTDEFTSLYHAMVRRRYSNGEAVVEQGTLRPQLLFINSGQVQLYTHVNGSEVPLKMVGQGEVIGAGTFFEASVWTVSVRSLGAELLVLSRRHMEKLTEKHTSLESRLIDFSAGFVSANAIFLKTKRSRRRHERKSLVGRAAATLLNKEGKETEITFKGDLFDISRGGLSFCVRVSRKKNANMLFGSRIRVGVPVGRASNKRQLFFNGKVVAVRGHHVIGNEYSLHVQFDEQLSHQELQQVLG